MSKKFYITTTLPYVNAEPHIGFALEIVQADVVARYHKLLDEEVVFNTGTDEHGLKIYRKALEQNKDPQKYCDEYAKKFNALKTALNLSYTNFIRTTDKNHIEAAQEFWKRCLKNGDIYKKNYKIKYCVGCELEKTESELVEGKCPIHPNRDLDIIEEENYFFRFSKYQDKLLELYDKNPEFVLPEGKLNEIKKFVEGGLEDFSISRLKAKMPWGIDVPDDPTQVMYVWFDALINYISTLGWPGTIENFKNFWPGVQVAGKDNLRQQSAMWQAMLFSAGIDNSKQIFIHGFLTLDGQKISKSLGNTINPVELADKYGAETVRYYLLSKIHPWEDSDFTIKKFEESYNFDLANGLGNLTARVAKLAERAGIGGIKPKAYEISKNIESFRFDEALKTIWAEISEIDRKVEETKPWMLDGEELTATIKPMVEKILKIAVALQPFLPETSEKIIKQLKAEKIAASSPMFPRIK